MISVLAVVVFAASVPLAVSETQQTTKAPDFTLTDINGQQVRLSALEGKIVVLEWVNVCQASLWAAEIYDA
ncbi:MAG: peroxiredoxin family protein [Planctomycetota bacterium]